MRNDGIKKTGSCPEAGGDLDRRDPIQFKSSSRFDAIGTRESCPTPTPQVGVFFDNVIELAAQRRKRALHAMHNEREDLW